MHNPGLRVFATARKATSISDLQERGIETLSLEVDRPDSIATLKAEIERLTAGSGLDYLVNNAGRNYTVPALDIDFDEVQETFDVNVFAVMRMCQAFAPLIIQAKGTIVQIGSIAGIMPYVFGSVYNASKAALHQYSNTLRVEMKPFGVKVVTIVTGGVSSNIARTERQLPDGSYYMPVNEEYQRRLKHSQESGFSNERYARSVVAQVLKQNPPFWFWEGHGARLVKFVDAWFPKWVLVSKLQDKSPVDFIDLESGPSLLQDVQLMEARQVVRLPKIELELLQRINCSTYQHPKVSCVRISHSLHTRCSFFLTSNPRSRIPSNTLSPTHSSPPSRRRTTDKHQTPSLTHKRPMHHPRLPKRVRSLPPHLHLRLSLRRPFPRHHFQTPLEQDDLLDVVVERGVGIARTGLPALEGGATPCGGVVVEEELVDAGFEALPVPGRNGFGGVEFVLLHFVVRESREFWKSFEKI